MRSASVERPARWCRRAFTSRSSIAEDCRGSCRAVLFCWVATECWRDIDPTSQTRKQSAAHRHARRYWASTTWERFRPCRIGASDGSYKKYELDSVDDALYRLRIRERTAIDRNGVRRVGSPSGKPLPAGIRRRGCVGAAAPERPPENLSSLQKQEQPNMTKRTDRHASRLSLVSIAAAIVIAAGLLLALAVPCFADDGPKPDPAGTATGDKTTVVDGAGNSFVVAEPTDKTAPDYAANKKAFDEYQAQVAKEPLAVKLADSVGHVRVATNFAWTLNTGYLVLFMQAGFALLTCGLVRKKNAAHLMMLNFAAYVFAFLAYYAVGYAFQFGAVAINAAPTNLGGIPTLNHFLIGSGQWGFVGGKGFFLVGPAYDSASNCLTLFEVVFMETAGYIIVGAVCERITFWAFLICELFIGAILYPIFGCWVWGGGWMSQLGSTMHWGHGYVDFAGSSVVHGVGGFCAMALSVILGPRLGKYGPDGKPRAFPAHNIVFVVSGTFILLFGWMGFNPGSTLGATDLRISVVAINTNLAAIAGSATAILLWYFMFGKPDITMACNGML